MQAQTPGQIVKFDADLLDTDSIITETDAGNIGIGTTTPSAKLHIVTDNPSDGTAAVFGSQTATAGNHFGVLGVNASPNGTGILGLNTSATSSAANGVIGEAKATTGLAFGVQGFAHGTGGVGIQGSSPNVAMAGWTQECGGGTCTFVAGTAGMFGTASGGTILIGLADNSPMFRVDSTGKVFANGGYQTGGADFAESLAVTGERSRYEPGDVVVIEQNGNRQVALARKPYSTLVAGIYSTKPGVLATPYALNDPRLLKEIPLAVVGIVPCKVTAENGAIKTGDLLVTSSIPGHAMRGTDRSRMLGAVVGKALEPLATGSGVIRS
jgi:hypothetical protein